jgi:hypothetical protein
MPRSAVECTVRHKGRRGIRGFLHTWSNDERWDWRKRTTSRALLGRSARARQAGPSLRAVRGCNRSRSQVQFFAEMLKLRPSASQLRELGAQLSGAMVEARRLCESGAAANSDRQSLRRRSIHAAPHERFAAQLCHFSSQHLQRRQRRWAAIDSHRRLEKVVLMVSARAGERLLARADALEEQAVKARVSRARESVYPVNVNVAIRGGSWPEQGCKRFLHRHR